MKNRIKLLRLLADLSQDALAQKVGTTKATIQKLENYKMDLTTSWMERLAKPLGCESPCELLEEKKEQSHDSDLALNFAIKVLICEMLQRKHIAKSDLQKEFQTALNHYQRENLPGAIDVMSDLLEYVSEPSPPGKRDKILRLLQLSPVGSA